MITYNEQRHSYPDLANRPRADVFGVGECLVAGVSYTSDGSSWVATSTPTTTNAAIIGAVLTGYSSGAGTVAATDTILQAVNKLNGNIALKATANAVSGSFTTITAITVTNGIITAITGT